MTLSAVTERLKAVGIEAAAHEAKLLICRLENISPAMLLAQRDTDFTSPALLAAVARREKHEPLQYILGQTDFYGETYEVSPVCLIPRADTEVLVEEAIARLPQNAVFADLCTGSGCIAISVLAHRPDCTALAADISAEALALAARNAQKNGVADRISFFKADLLQDIPLPIKEAAYILCNPPYIPTQIVDALSPEVKQEPSAALDGGEDGLLFYRTLLSSLSPCLWLFEIGYDQEQALKDLARTHGYKAVCKKDLGANPRLMILSR